MKRTSGLYALSLLAGSLACSANAAELPKYDHIVIVVEENKDYEQIIGNHNAPYINLLAVEGANLIRMFGEEHPSEGNYFWLFSGDNQNAGFADQVPIWYVRRQAGSFTKSVVSIAPLGGYWGLETNDPSQVPGRWVSLFNDPPSRQRHRPR
jgi:hypothetical protein